MNNQNANEIIANNFKDIPLDLIDIDTLVECFEIYNNKEYYMGGGGGKGGGGSAGSTTCCATGTCDNILV